MAKRQPPKVEARCVPILSPERAQKFADALELLIQLGRQAVATHSGDNPPRGTIGGRILEALCHRGMNKTQLEARTNIPRQTLLRTLDGRRQPTPAEASRIAVALLVPYDWIMTGAKAPDWRKGTDHG